MSSSKTCRWGILGTAGIARKNWDSIKNSGNATLTAVASRSTERAQQYIDECQACVPFAPAPRAIGTYEGLLTAADVDAVYIPLPTGIRKDWVVRAANAGKHVLVEKPVGCNSAEVSEMIAACKKNNVQFMDGVMFMHSGRLAQMRKALEESGPVGPIRRIASQFSFRASPEFVQKNIRASDTLEPMGCLGDLGWYNIRLTLWAMNYSLPRAVSGRLLSPTSRDRSGARTPMEFSAELFFDNGASASFFCSFLAENQQWATISGEKGYLHVRDFVLPFFGGESSFEINSPAFEVDRCDFNMLDRSRRFASEEYSNSAVHSQETNMIRSFSRIVQSRRLEPAWGDIALATQQVVDACLASARQGGAEIDPRGAG